MSIGATVVYHFEGLEGLYRAVLEEALSRLVPDSYRDTAVESDPKAKLVAFIELLVRALWRIGGLGRKSERFGIRAPLCRG
jgi:AcrR family transcriptional regulator